MMLRYLCLVGLTATLAACDGGDSLAPRELAGTWVSARIQPTNVPYVPDTLVLDARGRGRIAVRRFAGESRPYTEEWWTSTLHYDVRDDRVYFRWCLSPPGTVADCFGEWNDVGRLEDGGVLQVAPTSPISSVGPTPWVRVSR